MASVLTRGSTIFFAATCLDANGAPITPSGANLYLTYVALLTGARTKVTVAMGVSGNVVSASWDSTVAVDGNVHWSIKATGANNIVQDGVLALSANEANPTS
jgi:hypothetical protein